MTQRRCEEAAELAAIPETLNLKTAEEAILLDIYQRGRRCALCQGIAQMAEQYRGTEH